MAAHAGPGRLHRSFLLSGWIDSDDLAAAFDPAPCGCEMREEAARSLDEATAAALEAAAPDACERWQCPGANARAWWFKQAGVPPPDDAEHLDAGCRDVLVAVERLTGARGFTTCPIYYARQPHVHRAVLARFWADKPGGLQARFGHPTAVLMHAIELLEAGAARQRKCESDRIRREAEEAARKHPPPGSGGGSPSD